MKVKYELQGNASVLPEDGTLSTHENSGPVWEAS